MTATTTAGVLRDRLISAVDTLGDGATPIYHERPDAMQLARGAWYCVAPLECRLEPDLLARGERGWRGTWSVPVYCSSGPHHRTPADAQDAAWTLVERLLTAASTDTMLHSRPVLRVALADVSVDSEWSESDHQQTILSVRLEIETRGWTDGSD